VGLSHKVFQALCVFFYTIVQIGLKQKKHNYLVEEVRENKKEKKPHHSSFVIPRSSFVDCNLM